MPTDLITKLVLMFLNATSEGNRVRRKASHAIASAVFIAAGALLGIAALTCAAIALWFYTLPHTGVAGAWLAVAAMLLVLSLVASLALPAIIERRKPTPAPAPHLPLTDIAALLGDDAAKLFNNNKGIVLLTAFLGGMMAADERKK